MRSRAAWMSASVGLSNPKHLLEDFTNGGERVELAGLDVVEQPAKLRVVADSELEMASGAGRRDLKHLLCQVGTTTPFELSFGREPRLVLFDLRPERVEALAADGLGEDDRRLPAGRRAE